MFSRELAAFLLQLTLEIERPLSVLLDRSGHVVAVAVGDASALPIPEKAYVESRLSGYRVIHTHLKPGGLSREDLSVLFLNRLDAIVALETNSEQAYLAQLAPPRAWEEDWILSPPRPYRDYLEWDFAAEVQALEEELARDFRGGQVGDESVARAILVGLDQGDEFAAGASLAELAELARSAGAVVVHGERVECDRADPRYLVGRGKLDELSVIAYHQNAGVLIFDREMSPVQAREVERVTQLKVIDRTQLILDIFAQRAATRQARAQVELAQLRYLKPRLVGYRPQLSRLGGGIGTRGPGENQLERDRRKINRRIEVLTAEIERDSAQQETARKLRRKGDLPVIAITGYTNAGKTTLLAQLSSAQTPGQDQLFATLRPESRRGFLPGIGPVVFTDTVGFIRSMPRELLQAFRSTLAEVAMADVILHVLDTSEPGATERYQVVEQLLTDLGAYAPRLLVLNKFDRADPFDLERLEERLGGLRVSALNGQGILELRERLAELLLRQGAEPAAWAV